MISSASEWRRLGGIAILLLLLAFSLYLPSLFHYLFADDEIYLAFNNRIIRELPWAQLHQLLLKPANPWEYLPVRDLTYWLDLRVLGEDDFGFHLSNLVWYAVAAIGAGAVFRELILLCRPLWRGRATVLALCGVVIFVVHPVHVEAAVWVASRKDLLAGALSFFSLASLVRGLRHDWRLREMTLAAVLLLAACFSKASAMTTVLFMTVLALACWPIAARVSSWRRYVTLLCLWSVVALAFIVHMKMGAAMGIRIENHPGGLVQIERASRILSGLAGLLLLPYPLGLYHDIYRYGEWHWIVALAALLLAGVSVFAAVRRRSIWAMGVLLATLPCVVYLQLVPFTTWSLVSERFLFVPVVGLSLILIETLGRLERPRHALSVLLAITVPCAVVTWFRVAEWEMPNAVLSREYDRQPRFHNAIRDQILYTLLPAKRYSEARDLAQEVPRDYARDALRAYIAVEVAYYEKTSENLVVPGARTMSVVQNYCATVGGLKQALALGYLRIPREQDVSYNNLLRSLEQNLRQRYSDSERLCGAHALQ